MENLKGKLDLGKELSKNAQKQIIGGVTVVCTGGTFLLGGDCATQSAYCQGAHHGQFLYCY